MASAADAPMRAMDLWWGRAIVDMPAGERVNVALEQASRVTGAFVVRSAGRGRQTVTNRTTVTLERLDGCRMGPSSTSTVVGDQFAMPSVAPGDYLVRIDGPSPLGSSLLA